MPRGKKDKDKVEENEACDGEPSDLETDKKQQTGWKRRIFGKKKDKNGESSKSSDSLSPEDDSMYEYGITGQLPQNISSPLRSLPSSAPMESTGMEYGKAAEVGHYEKATSLRDSKKSNISLRANCSYTAQGPDDLDYSPGDILTVIGVAGTMNGHYYVRQSSGQRGYVHESRVTKVDVFESEPWFNNFTREMAEEKLSQGQDNGTYLIRPSKDDTYALSLLADNTVTHFKIDFSPNGKFLIEYKDTKNKEFDSVPALIRHFTEVRELGVCLKKHYSKEMVKNVDSGPNYSVDEN